MARPGQDAGSLYARVERRIPELSRRMVDEFVGQVPLYAHLPKEQLAGEITDIVTHNLRLFFRALREGRSPTEDELAGMRHSAARRAEERVPLDAVLTAYHLGGRMGWQALRETANPGEEAELLDAVEPLLSYVQTVTAAVAASYLEEQQAIYGEQRDAHRALAQALLTGQSADSLAARLGVSLSGAYLVLACRFDAHPDELDSGVVAAVAARRKLRRITDRLGALADGPVLSLLDPAGGMVLLPAPLAGLDGGVEKLRLLVDELQAAAGAAVTTGVAAVTERAAVPGAAQQAQDVLRIAVQLGRPPGAYSIEDVLLEYQLSRAGDALPKLAEMLEPLLRNPDLLSTLEAYLEQDLDRRRTASVLHVHPNTLDYRLRRVGELTGLDISTARGIQLAGAALAARRLTAAG